MKYFSVKHTILKKKSMEYQTSKINIQNYEPVTNEVAKKILTDYYKEINVKLADIEILSIIEVDKDQLEEE